MKKNREKVNLDLPKLKNWHAFIIISILVAVYFHEILLTQAYFWEDFLYQFYPFRNFAAVAIAGGELPLWNPYTFSGTPFQADIQSALFYIPNLLLSVFVSGGRLHFYWVELFIILHYLLAGVSMYLFAKEIGITSPGALFSSIVFTFSGFMITHAIHQVIICQVAWLPLILLLFRRALQRRSIFYCIISGLVIGHAVLAGFPQISLYIFFLLFLYFIFELSTSIKSQGIKSSLVLLPIAAMSILIAVALTAVQILPTIELAPLSQRAEITYQKSIEGSLSWEQLITVFMPKFFGASGAQGSTYWGPGAYWVFWETCFYLGIPAAIFIGFAIFGLKNNKYIAFFFGIGIFGILYALGDGFFLHKLFFSLVPGFDKFRSIGRMTLYFTLSGALLAGFGIDLAKDMIQTNRKAIKRSFFLIGLCGTFLWLSVQAGLFQPEGTAESVVKIREIAHKSAVTAMVLLFLSGSILLLVYLRNIPLKVAAGAFLLLQFIDFFLFGFNQNNNNINPNEYYARTSGIVNMLKRDGEKEYFRINSRQGGSMILDRNQGMVDRIFMMEGYTPLSLQRNYPLAKDWQGVCDLLNAKYRIVVDQVQRRLSLATSTTYLPRAFMTHNVKIISDEGELRSFLESGAFDPRRTVILEENPEFVPEIPESEVSDSVVMTSFSLNVITLSATTSHDGFLVLSEIYYPGWQAYVDGVRQKIYRADWNLRAFPLRAGEHKIEVRFEPRTFINGLWITAATIGLSIGGIVYSRWRKRIVTQHKDHIT